jgi:hypothetical protein
MSFDDNYMEEDDTSFYNSYFQDFDPKKMESTFNMLRRFRKFNTSFSIVDIHKLGPKGLVLSLCDLLL